MEGLPILSVIILGYFAFMGILRAFAEDRQRKFEYKMLQLRLSRKYILMPMIINLLDKLNCEGAATDEESKQQLMGILQRLLDTLKADDTNGLPNFDESKSALHKILEEGKLAMDVMLDIKHITDFME